MGAVQKYTKNNMQPQHCGCDRAKLWLASLTACSGYTWKAADRGANPANFLGSTPRVGENQEDLIHTEQTRNIERQS
jgi:hypothetical protein